MSAHHRSSGPRGNAYSEFKLTNWAVYDPFFAEGRAAFKHFESRLAAQPKFPRIIALPALLPDLFHACTRDQVKRRLAPMPAAHLEGLRAIFLLSGTRKQQTCWKSSLACYGYYWRACVFLCAHPYGLGYQYIDDLRDFYLDDVLVHEVAHHVDRFRSADNSTKEGFANAFVQRRGGHGAAVDNASPLKN
jgi:hypothetical protein